MNSNSGAEHRSNGGAGDIPATPQPEAELVPHRIPLVPERSDFLEGDAPAAAKVEAFLAQALAATGEPTPRPPPGPWSPGSAMRSCRTTRSRPTAATSWTSSGTCRPRASTPAGSHRRPREALQAGVTRGRQDLGDGGPAALGPARHLPAARRQGAGLLGDGPGHRRGQGPRQSRRTRRRR